MTKAKPAKTPESNKTKSIWKKLDENGIDPTQVQFGELTSILKTQKTKLGSVVNLDIGTSLVPEGLAIVNSDYYFLPLIFDIAVPSWQSVNYKEKYYKTCVEGTNCHTLLNNTIDQILDETCKTPRGHMADEIGKATQKIVDEFVETYEGSVNPEYITRCL